MSKPLNNVSDANTTELGSTPEPPPFTVFTRWHRQYIVFLATFAGMFSTLSSFIFYPAINSIADGLGVGVELINLSVTSYMVVAGVIPSLLGNAADNMGRRPIYISALVVYLVANVGLALQNSFPALLALRMVQSAGSSGMISLGYGVIADLVTPAERGFYVGMFSMGPNVAPPLGPIIGGALAARLGWKSIFWFLCIAGGFCLLLILLTLPETSRRLVGNGNVSARGIHRAPFPLAKLPKASTPAHTESSGSRIPNPLACLWILLRKDVAIVVLCFSIYYTTSCCMQASLSTLALEIYDLDELQGGLIYIPYGIGCLVSTFGWGKILNYEYARAAKRHGVPIDRMSAMSALEFPLEEARLRSSFPFVVATAAAAISYGWVLERRAHIAVPLTLQAIFGFSVSCLFVSLGTLNTDLNADMPSTAAASVNLVRCAMAAAALAVLQIMIDRMGVGWCFATFGLICALCVPLLIAEMRYGPRWRRERSNTV
ncbi:major facilitator superfamily transporter [Thozetella sp. PMI_491]|nr:major facilitator superfamily transporter [Thozetella sp. PMI_491]